MTAQTQRLTVAKKLDYWFQDDENWTIEDWSGLSETFDLTANDLELWHQSVHGQGRHWEITRLRFGVRLTILSDKESFIYRKAHTIEEVAKQMGMKVKEVQAELDSLCKFWRRTRATSKSALSINDSSKDSGLDTIDPYLHTDLDPEKVDQILKGLNLSRINDDEMKIHFAGRAMDFQSYLKQKSTRSIARDIIQKEVSAWHQERILNIAGNALTRADQSETLTDEQKYKKILSIQKEIQGIEKHLNSLQSEIRKSISEIGADHMDESEAKRTFNGSISEVLVRMKEYYAQPENILMDGVFTADEIIWLTEPTEFRDAQYRPDFVAMVNHAMKAENLWDPDFQEKGVGREATRRLLKIVSEMGKDELPSDEEIISEVPAQSSSDNPESTETEEPPPENFSTAPVLPKKEQDLDFIC